MNYAWDFYPDYQWDSSPNYQGDSNPFLPKVHYGEGGSCSPTCGGPLGAAPCAPGNVGALPMAGPSTANCLGSAKVGLMTCALPAG